MVLSSSGARKEKNISTDAISDRMGMVLCWKFVSDSTRGRGSQIGGGGIRLSVAWRAYLLAPWAG